ncbi:ABC transporter permease [Streptomyces capparidis]
MSATEVAVAAKGPAREPAKRRTAVPRPRGAVWLVWRRHRLALGAFALLTLLAVGFMLVARARATAWFDGHGLAACLEGACEERRYADYSSFLDTHRGLLMDTGQWLRAVPVLIGVFLGAPLFAREFEQGTHRLVWTQSAGRLRWFAAKLALPAAVTAACATVLSAAYTWWWSRERYRMNLHEWWHTVPYSAVGPVPVAMALLGLLLGATAGLLLRRTVPAMALTLACAGAVQLLLDRLHPLLLTRHTAVAAAPADSFSAPAPPIPDGAWPVEHRLVTDSGQRLGYEGIPCWESPAASARDARPCLSPDGEPLHASVEYHLPGDWAGRLQWTETGLLLAAAAALAALCLWWARRRPL